MPNPLDLERKQVLELSGIWRCMMSRCYNRENMGYKNYGGRGIGVCKRWHVFNNFAQDMAPRPLGLTLDRKDNDGDYAPSNCKWSTRAEQHSNTRRNRWLEHDGVRLTITQWATRTGIEVNTIRGRLKYGFTVAETLTPGLIRLQRKPAVAIVVPLVRHGQQVNTSKLNEADVLWIRANAGRVRQIDMANRLGVCRETIQQICRRATWKHI